MQQLLLELAPPPPPTLANFVAGRNAAAVSALANALSGGEPCVFLWGARGSGRSHLLRAFVDAAAAAAPSSSSSSSPAPRESAYLAAPGIDWSRAASPSLRAVAVDDVDRLDATGQVALFDLFNRLRAAGGAVIASGALPPADLSLRPDLRSRLGAGIVLQVHPLREEEKAAALRERAAGRGIPLGPEVIGYLLTHLQRDMGTQMAVLDALDRYSLEYKRPITLPLLRKALRSLGQPENSR